MINRIDHQAKPSLMLRLMKFIFWLIRVFIGSKVEYDIVKERKRFDRMAQRIPKAANVDIETLTVAGMYAEWIKPKGANSQQVLYYLHGGAYAVCSLQTHRRLIAKLAEAAGIIALAVEYRMAPEAPYPAATEDALAGYQHLLLQGYEGRNIIVAGDSAGGGLTAALLQLLRDNNLPQPALAVLISPWADLEGTGESNVTYDVASSIINQRGLLYQGKLYAHTTDIRHPLVSPIYADFTGLAPMYIVASRHELIFDDSVRIAAKADTAGIPVTLETYPHVMHVWQIFDYLLPEAKESIKRIGSVMRAALN